ncbi:uncharacterized protein LOC127136160 [Lathyrus oleraceus]|uniref:uncharacterized protein LOC127136160 n=1 Tax=Pisum sativum TaxID=3888 RepID=UPI0021D26599|nr:uncharacterized protein LOC127136160 [Pisum sativum]
MNIQLIERVKVCSTKVLNLTNVEEQLLKLKSKVEWLRIGDGNNAYFHASLKSRRRQAQIANLKNKDGNILYLQEEIDQEIVNYYQNLVGTANMNLNSIDIIALRKGPQLSIEKRNALISLVREKEIFTSLKGIKDLSAPGIDGYNAKSFKSTQDIIKQDIINVVKEFFRVIKSIEPSTVP